MSFVARAFFLFLLLFPLVAALDAGATNSGGNRDFAGLVDIGGGRKIYLECRGAGSPTVVLIAGKGNGAADWSKILDPADPVYKAPLDAVSAGEGHELESEVAVLPAVSRFTRVCTYDRPGTRSEGTDLSTPVAQPHRVDQDVDALRTLLASAGERGPYVLVSHSYGGLIALLYARLYPEQVAGLVMVDAASELISKEASAEELAGWDASNRMSNPASPEAVELLDAIERIEAVPPLQKPPAVVLSADKPWQITAPNAHGETSRKQITFPEWLAAQDLLAASLHAKHVAETHSGHHLYLYSPELVVDAIRQVVNEVRQRGEAASIPSQASIERQVQALAPSLEDYIAANMKSFDVPGLAIGIVGDKLIYAKGFGARSKGGPPVDTKTIFQIGSTTKAFLSATLAIAVDQGKLHWDDRVVDLDPDFQMRDPWVTREFRVFDLLAQRSGLPPYANDFFGVLGLDRSALIRSLRYIEPVSSFRTTFAYTNITHVLAGRIVAKAEGAADWNDVLQKDILDPLNMKDTTYSATAITAAADHALGYRYTADGSIEVPLRQPFPYEFDGAGDINSNLQDMAKWVILQLADGTTSDGQRIVSAENLAYTHTPKVAINDKVSYALGWIVQQTPNGTVVWHNGGTHSFGSMVALQLDRKLGIIVLSNQTNVGMPDAIGLWTMDRLLGNPMVDYGAKKLAQAKKEYADGIKQFLRPADAQPSPPLAALAGRFANPGFGKAILRTDGNVATLELVDSGARLRVDPWNGPVYTATLVPDSKFAAIAANLGPLPIAFAQFQSDKDGKPTILRLTFSDGQADNFKRE
jgi:CubicO group peptidase (beta-lactamase class C family)